MMNKVVFVQIDINFFLLFFIDNKKVINSEKKRHK